MKKGIFKYCNSEKFNTLKRSSNINNTGYYIGDSVEYSDSSPLDILWNDIVFIEDGRIWTHGKFYSDFSEITDKIVSNEKVAATALIDLDKRISDVVSYGYITSLDIANKVDKVTGKQLSTEDFTTAYMNKLNNISAYAEVNVQADWNTSDSTVDSYIKNKPDLTVYPTYAWWDSSSALIKFKNGNTVLNNMSISGANFIKDGMVENVEIKNYTGSDISTFGSSYLLIDFNTDSGKSDIKIPVKDIFDSDNYYTKNEIDSEFTSYDTRLNSIEIGYTYLSNAYAYLNTAYLYFISAYSYMYDNVINNEKVTSTALIDLNDRINNSEVITAQIIEESEEKYNNAYTWFKNVVLNNNAALNNAYTYYNNSVNTLQALYTDIELIVATAISEMDNKLNSYINGS